MFSLTKALARAEALEKIYDEALDALERLLEVDRSSILLFDSDSRMRFKAWRGLSEAYCRQAEGHSPWPREAREPAPILIPDAAAGCDVAPLRSLIPAEGIRALAFIPLFAQAKLLGAFALYYDAPHRFTSLEARVAETVASHVVIAIEHKRAEEDLKLYREIFAESSDGITILDRDGRYIALNGAYAELLGYSEEELAGRTPATHLGEARFAEIAGALARTGRYRGEVTSRARDGRTIQADLSAFSVRDERGEVLCHVGVNRDISHRKRAERQTFAQLAREHDALYGKLAKRRRARGEQDSLSSREWIVCDLHMHTSWSHDCAIEVPDLLTHAETEGLGAIAITDHNVFGGALEALAATTSLTVIPGEEVKTADQGEVIGLFLSEEIPRGLPFADTLAAIHGQGGVVYLPHPFDRMHSIPDAATLRRHLEEIDVFEVYNARLLFEGYNEEALRFARKYNLTMGAGSDAHVLQGVGTGALRMREFQDRDEFLASLRSAQVLRRPKSLLYLQSLKWAAQAKERVR